MSGLGIKFENGSLWLVYSPSGPTDNGICAGYQFINGVIPAALPPESAERLEAFGMVALPWEAKEITGWVVENESVHRMRPVFDGDPPPAVAEPVSVGGQDSTVAGGDLDSLFEIPPSGPPPIPDSEKAKKKKRKKKKE
jgi:hypothetical protein